MGSVTRHASLTRGRQEQENRSISFTRRASGSMSVREERADLKRRVPCFQYHAVVLNEADQQLRTQLDARERACRPSTDLMTYSARFLLRSSRQRAICGPQPFAACSRLGEISFTSADHPFIVSGRDPGRLAFARTHTHVYSRRTQRAGGERALDGRASRRRCSLLISSRPLRVPRTRRSA